MPLQVFPFNFKGSLIHGYKYLLEGDLPQSALQCCVENTTHRQQFVTKNYFPLDNGLGNLAQGWGTQRGSHSS